MKDINFIKTGMENFCCYTDLMEYEFKNNKVILITGPNGVGKSSTFSAVQFTLYGTTSSGLKSEEAINNVIGKNCHTYLKFTSTLNEITDNYRVDRYVKHSKLGDTVLLFKNDMTKPYKKGHKEVLPEIEKILVPQKLFINTLLFGQKVKDFFTDLPDSDRKDIFRKVLQLDKYVSYQDETTKRIKQGNIDLASINNKIEMNIQFLSDTNDRIILTRNQIKQFEINKNVEINSLSNKIKQLNKELLEFREKEECLLNINDLELNRLIELITTTQNEIDKIDMEIKNSLELLCKHVMFKESDFKAKTKELISTETLNTTSSISELNSDFQEYKLEMEKYKNEFVNNKNGYVNEGIHNNATIEKSKPEILKLQSSLNKPDATCPTCGKLLTEKSIKKHLLNSLNELLKVNEDLSNRNVALKELIEQSIEDEKKNDHLVKISKGTLDRKIKKIEDDYQLKINEIDKNFESRKLIFDSKQSEIENNCQLKVNEINQRLSVAMKKLNDLVVEKKKIIENEKISKKNILIESLNNSKSLKESLLKSIEEKTLLKDRINKLQSEIELNKFMLKNKENEVNNNLPILENYISEKNRLEEERKSLSIEKLNLENLLEILNFWKIGFSSTGIPSLLIDESIPFLNESVAKYLEMVGGRYKASFDTLSTTKSGEYRDKINVNVLDTQTKANNRKQLSGGQTRIIDIAILLSLCDLQNNVQNMKTNILLLDEIFDSLDDQNIGYVSNLLRTLVKDKSINIISHRHIDSIEADEVMRLF